MSKNMKTCEINNKSTWQELTIGAEIYEGGSSVQVDTGEWRTKKPILLTDKCTQCLLCVPYCPDSSIPVKDGKRTDFDYKHCKGCGICMNACPFNAIEMVKEER